MTEHREATGGLRSQLRSLAERGSFDGGWNEPRPQVVRVSRDLSIPGEELAQLKVTFQAERFIPVNSTARLLTRYSLSALTMYEELPPELVPAYVKFALQERHIQEWNEAQFEGRTLIIPTSDVSEEGVEVLQELMYRDMIDIDDTEFRFEREVGYTIDGRGQLLSEQRSDRFYDVDAMNAISDVVGKVDFRTHDGSIASWVEKATEPHPIDMDLLKHPDLRKLEYKMNKVEVGNFLKFAELVSRVEADKDLAKFSQRARQQELLSLLAFLRYDTPATEIMNLVQ